MVPCYFSDHRAIHLQGVLGKGFPPCPGSWKLNCALLEREEIVEELRGAYKMWKLDKVYFPTVAQWWEFMKVKFHSFFQAKGRCQECERRSELRRLQRKLHSLQDLQLFGWDVRKEVDETKEGQKRHFEEESRRIIFRSKVEYLEKGEKCNSFFFRKLHSAHTPLIELRDRDGRIQEGKEGVMKVLQSDIKEKQSQVVIHQENPNFVSLDEKLSTYLEKLEKSIMDLKQKKFLRDKEDYESNHVYSWKSKYYRNITKSGHRSILKT
ncbi:uncharacterized protein WCC33_016605 [Rhinophrynus dorsalis]